MRRREKQDDIESFLFKSIPNVNQWTVKPIKILISFAIVHGNPLFENIPRFMGKVNEE